MKADRISVVHFSNERVRGGAEEHMLTLLRGLNRELFCVHLACTPELARLMKHDLPADVEVFPLRLDKPWRMWSAMELAAIIRKQHIEVLHSHLFYASLFASPLAWLCRVPVVVETPHVREVWRRGLKSSYAIDRLVGRCVSHYIAVSEANGRYLTEDKGLPRCKVHVIHNGSDLQRFQSLSSNRAELKTAMGFHTEEPVLLVAGRLESQKGHSVILDALPLVRRRFPNVRTVFAGGGSLLQQLQQQVKRLGLQGAVDFVGFQSNIEEWFSIADITVLPSFYEGLPLVAIESQAAGTPLVATAVDGTPEIVINEKTGLTVPPGDSGALTEAICKLLADPLLRQQYGRAGRSLVFQKFSQEQQIRKTEQIYLSSRERVHAGRLDELAAVPLDPGAQDTQWAERAV
jgi:glycosyltransferase involved in cell wall biosynthesis